MHTVWSEPYNKVHPENKLRSAIARLSNAAKQKHEPVSPNLNAQRTHAHLDQHCNIGAAKSILLGYIQCSPSRLQLQLHSAQIKQHLRMKKEKTLQKTGERNTKSMCAQIDATCAADGRDIWAH